MHQLWWCEINKKKSGQTCLQPWFFINFWNTLFHLKKTTEPMYGHHFFSYTQKVWNNYLKCWAWWVNRVETICPLWRSTDLPILIANAEAKKKNLECIIQWRRFLVYVRGLVEGVHGETKKAAASVTYGVFKPQWTNLFNLSYWWHQRRRAEKWLDIGTTPFSSCFKKMYYNIFKIQNMFIWKE